MSIQSILNHTATRAVAAVGVVAVLVGSLYVYTQSNGGLMGFDQTPIVWISDSNIQTLLSLKPGKTDSQKDITAAPELPVLLIECPRAACESADLNLRKVTRELEGKVTVVALDPYDNKKFTAAVEMLFINKQLQQSMTINLAMQVLSQTGQPPSQEALVGLLSDEKFQAAVARQAASSPMMKPAYPKYFLFAAKDFHLMAAVTGISTHDDLISMVTKVAKIGVPAAEGDDAADALPTDDAADAPDAAAAPPTAAAVATPAPAAVVATPAVTPTPAAAAPAAAATPTPVAASAAPATPPPAPVVSGAAPATAVATPAPQAAVKP